MQIILSPEEAQVLRSLGAKINGSIGGSARTVRKSNSSRKNVKKAIKARVEAAHAA